MYNFDMSLPCVTIITPLYNYGKFLEAAVESVLRQTYQNWELIIVDDCSEDDSYKTALNIAKRDSRIKVLKLAKNGGTAAARNSALDVAKGDFIAFLDADDEYDSNYLAEQLHIFAEKNAKVVVSSYRRAAPNSVTDFLVPVDITFNLVLGGNPMAPLGTMYRRDAYPDLRFPLDMRKCEDLVFFLNLLKDGTHAVGNQNVLGTLRIHADSKSRKKIRLIKWQLKAYKKVGVPIIMRFYYLIHWAFYGLMKYRNVR